MNTAPSDSVRWLFLDLDSYFASCEQQARPDLRGKPVGVVPMMAETTCCLAASREAKKHGVKTGTLVAEARVRCPGITFVVARHDLYTLYHKIIVEAVGACLPIDAVLSIDEMICELTGSQRELSKAVALAETIKTVLRQRVGDTLTCSIGLAPNRFLAKVSSDMNKPDGLTIVRLEDLPHMLYPLKLQDFPGIGPRMGRRLEEHGISTVQELCGLSITQMADLWGGVVGERFCRWLKGEDVELAETVHRSLGHQHVLEPQLRTGPGRLDGRQEASRQGGGPPAQGRLLRAAAGTRHPLPGGTLLGKRPEAGRNPGHAGAPDGPAAAVEDAPERDSVQGELDFF